MPRKLKAWSYPDDKFIVIRDNDNGDCANLKAALTATCANAGRPGTLVRIACQELEAWYFGDPDAMARAFNDQNLKNICGKARFRRPDLIPKPSRELERLCSGFQKVSGARAMAPHISYVRSKSPSFRALIDGIAKVAKLAPAVTD